MTARIHLLGTGIKYHDSLAVDLLYDSGRTLFTHADSSVQIINLEVGGGQEEPKLETLGRSRFRTLVHHWHPGTNLTTLLGRVYCDSISDSPLEQWTDERVCKCYIIVFCTKFI